MFSIAKACLIQRWTGTCAGIAMVLALYACTSVWQPVNGRLASHQWSIQVPEGWMRYSTPVYEMLSKDGPYLEYIFVQSQPLSQGFRYTRRKIGPNMLSHEMAQIIIDNTIADPQINHFNLLSSAPAMVGGQMGFKLVYSYQDRHGVDMQTIYYGAALPSSFFNLRYTATQRHYFSANLDDFEQVFQSLQWPDGT